MRAGRERLYGEFENDAANIRHKNDVREVCRERAILARMGRFQGGGEQDGTRTNCAREKALNNLQEQTRRLCSKRLDEDGKGETTIHFVDDGDSRLGIVAVGGPDGCGVGAEKEEMVACF